MEEKGQKGMLETCVNIHGRTVLEFSKVGTHTVSEPLMHCIFANST